MRKMKHPTLQCFLLLADFKSLLLTVKALKEQLKGQRVRLHLWKKAA